MSNNYKKLFTSLKSSIYSYIIFVFASIGFSIDSSVTNNMDMIQIAILLGVVAFVCHLLYLNTLIKLFNEIS